ncbi:MAG: M23 family metallopeptidase [Anaerolineales bacterium]|nr:M23 family metallopeptidase [Anaerolineales bacterium]
MPLFLPTYIPAEGAEYRPPIYPIPWALSPHDHFYFAWPISAWYPADPVSDYRYGGTYFGPDIIHTGIDLPAPRGTEVMAAGPGTVVWSGYGLFSGLPANKEDPYGIAIAIRHDFGYRNQPLYTIYAHLSETDVIVGQWVQTGEVIGNVGETGVTTGPHLHFEVRLGENTFYATRNPELWLAPPQGYGVLAARIMRSYGDLLEGQAVYLTSLETGKRYEGRSYINFNVTPDDYYQENLVIGNLPAGVYEILINYTGFYYKTKFEILPGQVNFFKFYGYRGFYFEPPATPTPRP